MELRRYLQPRDYQYHRNPFCVSCQYIPRLRHSVAESKLAHHFYVTFHLAVVLSTIRLLHARTRRAVGTVWRSQIRPVPNSAKRIPRMRSPAFICTDVALVTYVTPGPSFPIPCMHFYLQFGNNNNVGIPYVLLTETMLITKENLATVAVPDSAESCNFCPKDRRGCLVIGFCH